MKDGKKEEGNIEIYRWYLETKPIRRAICQATKMKQNKWISSTRPYSFAFPATFPSSNQSLPKSMIQTQPWVIAGRKKKKKKEQPWVNRKPRSIQSEPECQLHPKIICSISNNKLQLSMNKLDGTKRWIIYKNINLLFLW